MTNRYSAKVDKDRANSATRIKVITIAFQWHIIAFEWQVCFFFYDDDDNRKDSDRYDDGNNGKRQHRDYVAAEEVENGNDSHCYDNDDNGNDSD